MRIDVNLGERSYPVLMGRDVSGELHAALVDCLGQRSYALITNSTLNDLFAAQIAAWQKQLGLVSHVIDDGEQHKNIGTWKEGLDTLLSAGLDRQSALIAFGGGVVGDVGGFVAATFLRGIDYVQVPTTLLAMVDSSVGGKTAVNHPAGKNLVGAFHQPRLVWIDTAYLDTLPRRQFLAGYAEMFKNAFIGGRDMFDFVNTSHEALLSAHPATLAEGIERSVRIKASVVESDEREAGVRALLNFGHTFAHALERSFHYEGIIHGEAVLWGMACACDLGKRVGTIASSDVAAYDELLGKLPLPPLPATVDPEVVYQSMFSDKKKKEGKLRFVLPAEPGTSVVSGDVGSEEVLASLQSVLALPPRN